MHHNGEPIEGDGQLQNNNTAGHAAFQLPAIDRPGGFGDLQLASAEDSEAIGAAGFPQIDRPLVACRPIGLDRLIQDRDYRARLSTAILCLCRGGSGRSPHQ